MPDGFGVIGAGASASSLLADVRIPTGPGGLGTAALSATQRLAAAAGHPLSIPSPSSSPEAHSSDAIPVLARRHAVVIASVRDPDRIMAAVKDAHINRIDYLLITHFHTDHVGGVPQLAARIPVGTFIDHGPNREAAPERIASPARA